jgi:hypothetical protein
VALIAGSEQPNTSPTLGSILFRQVKLLTLASHFNESDTKFKLKQFQAEAISKCPVT